MNNVKQTIIVLEFKVLTELLFLADSSNRCRNQTDREKQQNHGRYHRETPPRREEYMA
jgi:hypothetical protein